MPSLNIWILTFWLFVYLYEFVNCHCQTRYGTRPLKPHPPHLPHHRRPRPHLLLCSTTSITHLRIRPHPPRYPTTTLPTSHPHQHLPPWWKGPVVYPRRRRNLKSSRIWIRMEIVDFIDRKGKSSLSLLPYPNVEEWAKKAQWLDICDVGKDGIKRRKNK